MCGRYSAANREMIAQTCFEEFSVHWPSLKPRFNIAPSQLLATIARDDTGKPTAYEMRWGLVPFWDKSEKPKIAPINAKSEQITAKPMFRHAIQKRRCLLPADGFFEWKKLADHVKQPFHITLSDARPFYLAGIFEPATETRPATVAILTTKPNTLMEPIHTRMPVILTGEAAHAWLNAGPLTPDELAQLTVPYAADKMRANPVSMLVNFPKNDSPEVITYDQPNELNL